MDVTGGAYMSQPFTNSEAVRRCLTIPNAPLSHQVNVPLSRQVYIKEPHPPRQVCIKEPCPPYAIGRGGLKHRPQSAPSYQTIVLIPRFSMKPPQPPRVPMHAWNTISNGVINRCVETPVSMQAPYAPRKIDASTNTSAVQNSFPKYQRLELAPSANMPQYTALNDPHLSEYFCRKFAMTEWATRSQLLQSSSAFSLRSSSRPSSAVTRSSTRRKKATENVIGEGPVLYKISITTGDKKGAGTDAKVFVRLKGTKGSIPKTRLIKQSKTKSTSEKSKGRSFTFARGTTHVFKLRGPELGDIKSLNIETSGSKKEESWFLQDIEVTHVKKKRTWVFLCNQWLSLYHADQQTARELFPSTATKTEYEIVTVTGEYKGAGTDANVFITIYGKTGVTPKLHLKNNSKTLFESSVSDTFIIKTNCVGPLSKVRIEHDNTGFGAGWYLERIVVTDLRRPKSWKYFFPCGQWLAVDEGDGAICRDLVGSKDPLAIRKANKYKVTVYTGDKRGSGTDANVSITMFGEAGDSGEKRLSSRKNNFERGQADEFVVECPCLGRLERIRIGHDDSGFGPGWFLDKVIVDDLGQNSVYEFPCSRWLANDEDDGLISRELLHNVGPMDAVPGVPYIITVTTGDKRQAGTNSRIYVIFYGGKGGNDTSGKIWLDGGNFDRGRTDIFNVEVGKCLSPLNRIDVGHDNKGTASGWYLNQIVVNCPSAGLEQTFLCDKWLAIDEGDGVIQRTLYEHKSLRKSREKVVTWYVWVHTSDTGSAGTDANVFICCYGDKGKSDDIAIRNKTDNFEKGATDQFKIEMVDIGNPYKLRVWHDNSGMFAGWHLNKIIMEHLNSKKRYIYTCDRWLADDEDDHQIVREIPAEGQTIKKPLSVVHYLVEVHTGKKRTAGTDANVFINIFGDLGDTGERPLTESKNNRNKFEKGQIDEFEIEAVTLQKLSKIKIGHDGTGPGSGWFLDKVVIKQTGNPKYDTVFECNRWLSKGEDDGAIVREIAAGGNQLLNTTSYHVSVKTGDVRGAGTDAKVTIKLFGTDGDTGHLVLRSAENTSNKFERGRTDQFNLEAMDIGKIKTMQIGHDDSSVGAGWFLDEVRIDVPSRGEQYLFACHRWLAKDEGDGLTEIELEPSTVEKRDKTIPYEITSWTADVSAAGTDANVFLQMYGEKGKSEEVQLRNRTDNFEQGQMDKFKIEATDVGRLQKIRIGHDGKGMMSGWFLEKLLIQRPAIKELKRRTSKLSASDRRQSIISSLQGSTEEEFDSDSTTSSTSPSHRQRRRSGLLSQTDSPRTMRKRSSVSPLRTVIEEDDAQQMATVDYWFFVSRWFARSEDDGMIVRELIPTDAHGKTLKGALEEKEYTVRVFTSDVFGAGTDANVFIHLYGKNGDSGERQLKKSSNINKFEKNQEDVFPIQAFDLGDLNKVKIRHDNAGGGAAWFLDRIEIDDVGNKKSYFFPCQRWLATGEDDGQIARELVPVDPRLKNKLKSKDSTAVRDQIALETKAAMTTYNVKVTTSKIWGAGTDANVYVILFGENDNTGQMFLKSSLTHKNKFESNQTDNFILEAVNIGDLRKIKIGHDNAGGGAAWHLDNLVIDSPSLGKAWTFPCGRWLSKSDDDGEIERELYPQELATEQYVPSNNELPGQSGIAQGIPYEITTYTTDKSGASTDANVFIVLYGKDRCTKETSLCTSKRERKDKFKRGATDKFVVEMEDIGDTVEKLRIGHDGSGFGAGWHCQKVEVRKLYTTGRGKNYKEQGSTTFIFQCNKWLASDEDDFSIVRELIPEKIIEEKMGDDGQIKMRERKFRDSLISKKYSVSVYTGDVRGAGTDANVFLNIFGDKGDTGERKLLKSETNRDKFEKGKMDKFSLEAGNLGKVYKIHIRHDNSLINPSWFLDKVEVIDTFDNEAYVFNCERWLAKNKDDGRIERSFYVKGYDGDMMSSQGTLRSSGKIGSVTSLDSLRSDPFSKSPRVSRKQMLLDDVPEGPTIPYTVKVTTGDGADNGTESNVWIKIIGPKKKHSGRLFLELAQKGVFEPGKVETFSMEAVDVDEVRQIELGHDGVAPGSGWFVKDVEVDLPTKGKHYQFICKQWLARDKGDGKTSRMFSVQDGQSTVTSYKPMVPFEVTLFTGDVDHAGTDSQITMTVFGSKGASSEINLDKLGERFERGRPDLIKMEIDDIGPLKKLRIGHDGKGSRPDWYLEQVEARNMDTGDLTRFKCNDWFSKTKGDGKLTRDIPATVKGKQLIKSTSYKVNVKTSAIRGSGTDANVYIMLFGENGDSGEIHLNKSETYSDPFEKDHIDVFNISEILSLGELSKLRVWHDNKGLLSSWHLSYIEVEDIGAKRTYTFHCDKWLSRSEDDKQIVRELTCANRTHPESPGRDKDRVTYQIEVRTTDKQQAGTIHNGWIILEGSLRSSKAFLMENSPHKKILRRGQTDYFEYATRNVGKLERCILGAVEREDKPLQGADDREVRWHCYSITITDTVTGDKYSLPCKDWIPITNRISKRDSKELLVHATEENQVAAVRNLAVVKYEVVTVTGDISGAGTNANVSINIFGENGDTGKRPLKQKFRDLFERNQVDKFQIEALDLGQLTKVHIEHDNSGFSSGWFLERIEITNMATNVKTVFPCQKWLDKKKDDREISRDLLPAMD